MHTTAEVLGALIEVAPFASAVLDREMRYLFVSRGWREDYGLGDRDLRGVSHYEVFPEIPDRWKEAHRRGLAGEFLQQEEDRFDRADGSVQWLRWQIHPWFEERDKVGGIIISVENITARKRAEEELRLSEERYRGLVEATADIVWNGRIVGDGIDVPAWREITGQTTEEARLHWTDAVHPDDRAEVVDAWSRFIRDGGVYKIAYRLQRRDGEYRWMGITGVSVREPDGSIREFIGTFRDITDRKKEEEKVRQREAMLQGILDNLQDAYFRADLSGKFIMASPSAARMYGYASNTKMVGMHAAELYADVQDRESMLARLRQAGQLTGVVARSRRKDGSLFWVSINVQFVRDSNGNVIGTEGVVRDVSKHKQLEQELLKAKERLREEKLYLEQEIDTELGFQDILGASKALKSVLQSAAIVANTDAAVLVLGETGTGKELVARAIHRLSRRSNASFIKMNCAAIPTGLLESELFGAEKGAYTGALNRKIGRIELADHGTLFLDEIAEVPLALQPKLLRVLQDQEFERLGGTETLKVNFRLIAATNRNLSEEVQKRNFRQDLYYRLNVFPIHMPPLRERRGDIPLLVEHFVHRSARQMNKPITSIPKLTMDAMVAYDWPGNVRELENFIERSVILSTGSVLEASVSELEARSAEAKPAPGKDRLEDVQRQRIIEALRASKGNTTQAAARLGVKRTTLQSKMKQLRIDPRD